MKKFLHPIVLLAVISALGVVGYSVTRSRTSEITRAAPVTKPAAPSADALKIALTPIGGQSKIDLQIAELQAQLEEAPERHMLLERLGWAFVAKARLSSDPGFYTLAEQTAKAMTATTPNDPAAALLLGHVSHAQHRFAVAETIARTLTSQREFVFDYALLGDALMEQGKLREAVEAYQKMVDLKPCLQTYSRVAHMRWLKGDLAGAIAASRLAISGGSPREPEGIAWAYTRLAQYELQAGNIERASASVKLASEFVPDYAPALLMRGRALLAQGKSEEAVNPLRLAAEASPLPEYLWTLAEALRVTGQTAEAEKAEARLKATGAQEDPRTLALFLASRGEDAQQALKLAAAELDSRHDIFTYDAMAWSQLASGKVAEAQESMRHALSEGTQDARLFYHAGAIASAAGNAPAALEFYNKAHGLALTLLPSERDALGEKTAALANTGHKISANIASPRSN